MSRFTRCILPLILAVALFSPLFAVSAEAWNRTPAERFATLPAGSSNPEGITADGAGNIYVTGFSPAGALPGQLTVFAPNGKLVRQVSVAGASGQLLGLAFHPISFSLLVIDFGNARVLRVDPTTGASSVFFTVGGSAGLNGLAFDAAGNVYVSDSFQGIIWRSDANGDGLTAWVTNVLLTTSGVPPFGANGLAFNNAGDALFVANTGNDTVVRIPVTSGVPGTPAVFVNSINGADGLGIDGDDNIWVCANQADEIVVLDPTGRVIAKLGDFDGIDSHGRPIGLLFPASFVFVGNFVYVTNLALDLRLFGLAQAVDSQWAAQVTSYTVAKIKAKIPNIPGRP